VLTSQYYILLAIVLFIIIIALKGIKQVPQAQAMIVERLGKYLRTLDSGINFIVPFLDKRRVVKHLNFKPEGLSIYSVDLREQVYDIPSQPVITRDNISLTVDTLIFYQIIEPHRALYEIADLITALREISKTTMRNVFGEMDLDTSLSSRELINQKLRGILDEATDKWGVKVLRVEVQDIVPPADLKEDMERQMRAERTRRQEVTIAEGKKQAAILEAEGIKQSLILNAQGEAESRIMRADAEKQERILLAQGEAESIKMVQEAKATGLDAIRKVYAEHKGAENLLMMEILRSQGEIAKDLANGSSQKIFLPTEAAGLFGSLAALKELLATKEALKTDV